MSKFKSAENQPSPAQLTKYRSKIRSAYQERELSSEQIEQLRSAGFSFDATGSSKRIIDLTTGEVFETQSDATAAIGAARGELRLAIRSKRLLKGHAFWYADDPNPPEIYEYRKPKTSSKPIIDLTAGKRYGSLSVAAKAMGTAHGKVIRSAIEHKRLCKGHAFWWADDPNPPDISEFREPANRSSKPIIDLTTGKVFESMDAAAASINCPENQLWPAIRKKRLVNGHAFWWADDPNPPAENEFRATPGTRSPIIDLTTGEVFESMDAIEKSIDIVNRASLREAIADKRLYKGHAFWWADDPNPPDISEFREPANGSSKPVIDLTTGEVFESMDAAAKAFGVSNAGALRNAIKDKRLYKGHALWWANVPDQPTIDEFKVKSTTAGEITT